MPQNRESNIKLGMPQYPFDTVSVILSKEGASLNAMAMFLGNAWFAAMPIGDDNWQFTTKIEWESELEKMASAYPPCSTQDKK